MTQNLHNDIYRVWNENVSSIANQVVFRDDELILLERYTLLNPIKEIAFTTCWMGVGNEMHTLAIYLCDQANTWYILNFPRQILELAWSYNHWKLAQSYLERFVFWRNRKKEIVHWCDLFLFTYHYSPTWQDLWARHKSKTEAAAMSCQFAIYLACAPQ